MNNFTFEELIVVFSLIVAGIVCRKYYVNCVKNGKSRKQKFIEKAKINGNFTSGKFVDVKIILADRDSSNPRMRSESRKVKYSYVVNGVEYFKYMTFQNVGRVSVDYPFDVTVYYNPNNPKNAVCPEEATNAIHMQNGCLVTIFIFCLITFCLFHFLRFIFNFFIN